MKSLYSPTMFLWQIVGNDGFVWGKITPYSDAASGWALAHPEFWSSVNPITAMGANFAHHITASPPGFENPAASLHGHYYF